MKFVMGRAASGERAADDSLSDMVGWSSELVGERRVAKIYKRRRAERAAAALPQK